MPGLLRALRKQDENNQQNAVEVLTEIGPKARKALPILRELMKTEKGKLRLASAIAVWRIDQPRNVCGMVEDPRLKALRVLIVLLTKRNSAVRKGAATALGRIGREAQRAVPALITALKDKEEELRENAVEALGHIGPAAISAVPALIKTLDDDEYGHRIKVILALCKIDPRNRRAIAALPSVLGQPEDVVSALVGLGPEAKVIVPALLRALRNDDRNVYLDAARALRQIDPKTADKAGVP
jgi:HEAT repeat protein